MINLNTGDQVYVSMGSYGFKGILREFPYHSNGVCWVIEVKNKDGKKEVRFVPRGKPDYLYKL